MNIKTLLGEWQAPTNVEQIEGRVDIVMLDKNKLTDVLAEQVVWETVKQYRVTQGWITAGTEVTPGWLKPDEAVETITREGEQYAPAPAGIIDWRRVAFFRTRQPAEVRAGHRFNEVTEEYRLPATANSRGVFSEGVKYLWLEQLTELLGTVPTHSLLCVNRVGNLSLLKEGKGYIGYIDFLEGTVELYE